MSRNSYRQEHEEDKDIDVVYGRWPVREALEAGPVMKVFIAKGAEGGPVDEIVALTRKKNVPCHFVERRMLDQMVGDGHQGVVAQAAPVKYVDYKTLLTNVMAKPPHGAALLFLDGIQDPQNLGSLIRSAAFFGVRGVVIGKWRAASLTSAVVRASAGAARVVPVAQVSNVATAMEAAKEKGLWLVGADMDGEDAKKADIARPFALVMGAEGEGLHDLVRKKCDFVVRLNKGTTSSAIASLNVGVAGGILMHHFS
jgi:23S rRNA (guanosine2251-2'-O)-methyltransferase